MTIISITPEELEAAIERAVDKALSRFVDAVNDEPLTRSQAAKLVRRSSATIKRWQDRGRITPVNDRGRDMYSRRDILKVQRQIVTGETK